MSGEEQQTFDPEALFRESLNVVDRVARNVCRSARLRCAYEIDDFVSSVMVSLMEHDYAILRKWQGRGSLAGFLSVVVRRLLADRRDRQRGRWHPSTEAARGGVTGVLLEKLLIRDRCSLEEAVPRVQKVDPSRTAEELAAMAAHFPKRAPRSSTVHLDCVPETSMLAADRADQRVIDREARQLAQRVSAVIRHAIAAWPAEDATIFRLRFGSSMTIADIARLLRIPQRSLYRRVEGLIACLRAVLQHAGFDAASLAGVIGDSPQEMDFGLERPVAVIRSEPDPEETEFSTTYPQAAITTLPPQELFL
jgi:RNA polymerase sigma factor (sigma-70 family)